MNHPLSQHPDSLCDVLLGGTLPPVIWAASYACLGSFNARRIVPASSLQSLMFHEMEFSELNMKVDFWAPWFKNNVKSIQTHFSPTVIAIIANKNVKAMNSCIDAVLDELEKNYTVTPCDTGEYEEMKKCVSWCRK